MTKDMQDKIDGVIKRLTDYGFCVNGHKYETVNKFIKFYVRGIDETAGMVVKKMRGKWELHIDAAISNNYFELSEYFSDMKIVIYNRTDAFPFCKGCMYLMTAKQQSSGKTLPFCSEMRLHFDWARRVSGLTDENGNCIRYWKGYQNE